MRRRFLTDWTPRYRPHHHANPSCVAFDQTAAKSDATRPPAAVAGVVEEMVKQKLVTLIVPSIVVDEFRRNRARIVIESTTSLSSHFRLVRDAVGKLGGDKRGMRVVQL
jgi:hypothetical protein